MRGKQIKNSQIQNVLNDIVKYTVFHFEAEEKLMENHHFPDFESHKILHEKLIEKVTEVLDTFKTNGIETLPKITSFLSNWLKGHILGTDRKYALHINAQNTSWSSNLSVGIKVMDDQHQVLIDYLNDFKEISLKAKQGQLSDLRPVKELIEKLITYTLKHFKEEEALMAEYEYPKFKDHLKLHERLVKQVLSFKEKFHDDPILVIPELSSFLSRWLIQHIQGADMEYAQHIKSLKDEEVA